MSGVELSLYGIDVLDPHAHWHGRRRRAATVLRRHGLWRQLFSVSDHHVMTSLPVSSLLHIFLDSYMFWWTTIHDSPIREAQVGLSGRTESAKSLTLRS